MSSAAVALIVTSCFSLTYTNLRLSWKTVILVVLFRAEEVKRGAL